MALILSPPAYLIGVHTRHLNHRPLVVSLITYGIGLLTGSMVILYLVILI
ncbi:MAG: hypothetical protein M3552_15560 [Planctomycetota bacterium]|nr:hypothetical protein [Planctomycetaceae bacterium]MDQ3332046.1 hypothetical protein [Planctomycetota bacterium]